MPRGNKKADAVPFLLRLPPDVYEAVRSLADRETRSMNGEIVHLLRERLCYPGYQGDPWQSRSQTQVHTPAQAPSAFPPPASLPAHTPPPPLPAPAPPPAGP